MLKKRGRVRKSLDFVVSKKYVKKKWGILRADEKIL